MNHIESGAGAGRRIGLVGGLLAVLLTAAACGTIPSMGDDISYAPPESARTGSVVLRVPGDNRRILRLISADLQRAGFKIDNLDPSSGELRARSRRPDLVDCGSLTQTALGTTARIDGTAPLAAIFSSKAKGGVLRREVRTLTEVTVNIAADDPGKATLDEKQTVTLRNVTADGATVLSSQTLAATKGAFMAFSDGTICTSSGKLVDAFR